MTHLATRSCFVSEPEIYALLERAGLSTPAHGMLGEPLPFRSGDPVVLKGLGDGLFHKSECGAVRFLPFDISELVGSASLMQQQVEAGGLEWLGALVCERITKACAEGLPTEAFVSLTRGEGGWTLLMGLGGLRAEALAEGAPALCWPMEFVDPGVAFNELCDHLLGRIWLGQLRGTTGLTSEQQLRRFLTGLWTLRDLAEVEGLELVELNPVAIDEHGEPRPLDGVGRRGDPARLPQPREYPPAEFLTALLEPRRVALAGVSAAAGGVGRTILTNLQRCRALNGNLLLIKPGHERFLDVPCVPDVAALLEAPVDLLILALPAAATFETVSRLLTQGGGARVVALVAGGIGDGADRRGLGARLVEELQGARASGRWAPALLGPNFLGHWVPGRGLDSSFIPAEKFHGPDRAGGAIALLSQSGAFLLSRLSRNRHLPIGFALALGNQLDIALPDVLEALEAHAAFRVIGLYVEGFGPGELAATAGVAKRLCRQGRRLLLYRGGRTAAGQCAAASHTGAIAGDWVLEEALLRRAGVFLAETQQAFDAGLAWLGAYPALTAGPVAVVTNAGFESVTAGDLLKAPFTSASLDLAATERLEGVLAREGLAGLVAARLPLDLTPMANERAYLGVVESVPSPATRVLILGLIPFTPRLQTEIEEVGRFGESLAALALSSGTAMALVVDAGGDFEGYRTALAAAGLPVFQRMEDAVSGLQALVGSSGARNRAVS